MLKIAFHTPQIDVRGTCSALFDYAYYNELLLKNQSIIVIPKKSIIRGVNDPIAIVKFKEKFSLVFYENTLYNMYFAKYQANNNKQIHKWLKKNKVSI